MKTKNRVLVGLFALLALVAGLYTINPYAIIVGVGFLYLAFKEKEDDDE